MGLFIASSSSSVRLSLVQHPLLLAFSVLYYTALELLSLTTLHRTKLIARFSDIFICSDNIKSGESDGSDYGICSAESAHSVSLLVSSYVLMGGRVQKRPRVRGG